MGRLGGVIGRIGGLLSTQAGFRDWVRATRENAQIECRDEHAGIIEGLEPQPGSDAQARVDRLLESIYIEKVMRSLTTNSTPPDLARILVRIERDLALRANGQPISFNTKLLLLLDLVANLREK